MTNYSAQSIEVLDGLDPVRKRPGMYTDPCNPNHIAGEVIDNSVDEALAGFASKMDICVYEDGSFSVQDDGRGMPIDDHPDYGISGVELILTKLHSGAKFNRDNYAFSGGLHGVGVSVVNALSSRVQVIVQRQGICVEFNFHEGACVSKAELKPNFLKQRGTFLRFWPDARYFDEVHFDTSQIIQNLHAKAMLCPGLAVNFKDEIRKIEKTWCYQSGMNDFLLNQVKDRQLIVDEVIGSHFEGEGAFAQWALIWGEHGELPQSSYVNLIPTPQGGTHVNGLRVGLYDAIREFVELRDLMPKGLRLKADDVCLNLGFILSLKLQEAHFVGQTKQKLITAQAQQWVQACVKSHMVLWLNKNVESAGLLVESIIENARLRMRKSKLIERKRVVSGPQLPGKLIDCSSKNLDETEIFLVEGDSAKGTVRQARDRINQAILPLRGKILNTWEVDSVEILNSQEINDISVAIGLVPGVDSLQGLRYGKICILADADSDGLHIATLLCALFLKHFPRLVREGHLYVAMPPLYRIDINKQVFYVSSDAERDRVLNEYAGKKANVMRFKGLGEMSPEQLRETTIKPGGRKLVQISMPDEQLAVGVLDRLLAKKNVSERRSWIENNADLVGQS
ncbi:MAG: DNA topoisomerase IV subunit B [Gammaproteobacteria bacterium]|jgi:topoisomerase-4 subunit B|nr:DNA topoisomerase IV subunit B [Gammaproteobacteria bacterium]